MATIPKVMDPIDFVRSDQGTIAAPMLFKPSDNEVLFPIPSSGNTTSQASIWMKNISDFQVVVKVDCSNPARYKCDAKFMVLDRQQEVILAFTRLYCDEGQLGTGTVTDPDAIVPIDEEGNVMDSVRISTIITPKAVWDINGVSGK